jgi:hypothetical protein
MNALRIKTSVINDNQLILDNLPFKKGKRLEILILEEEDNQNTTLANRFPLRGTKIKFINPTEPVLNDSDWDALK